MTPFYYCRHCLDYKFNFNLLTYQKKKFNFNQYCFFREKTKLREDIATRRQKKLMLRHDRQKYLEDAALREAELLQELDRFNSYQWLILCS
jgi:hypothetical protein